MADKGKGKRLADQLSQQGSAIATQNSETEDEVKESAIVVCVEATSEPNWFINQILSVYQGSNSSGTRKRLADWYTEQWTEQLTKEDLKQGCTRCKEMGHPIIKCPYPVHYINVPDGATGSWESVLVGFIGKNRCKRCG